jgi:hypothetical protein
MPHHSIHLSAGFVAALVPAVVLAVAEPGPRLEIDADHTLRPLDRHRLLGTNVALWNPPALFTHPDLAARLADWRPAQIRLPGGSWSNEFYWNGHGVRLPDGTLDSSKRGADGRWSVDYSDYAPGFRVAGDARHAAAYQGETHVLVQHEFIHRAGAEPFVTVNFGSGDARMAAEWARFAKARGFDARYWEVGNELNGEWEMGHRLPDGTRITGRLYAERYKEYAAAIKAADPAARVGGPASSDLSAAFVEDLLAVAGDQVDFVSVHAYPVGVQLTEADEKFAALDQLAPAIDRVKALIRQHQPARADQIELGVTEWNIKVHEDRDTGDILGGLWSAAWIGEMFLEGVHFAHQWDLFTTKQKGGHGVFQTVDERLQPKAAYWANFLWSRFMADRLVSAQIVSPGSPTLRTYATVSDKALHILVINGSERPVSALPLSIRSSRALSAEARLHLFSRATYFWDPHAHRPVWSLPPRTSAFAARQGMTVDLPASSAAVIELPWSGREASPLPPPARETTPALRLVLPATAPADLPVEGWVLAVDSATGLPWRGALPPVSLSLEGPAAVDLATLPLAQSVARFQLSPREAGPLRLRATAGPARTEHLLSLEAVAFRDLVIHSFENPVADWRARSHFTLRSDPGARPNQSVAEAVLENALPAKNADDLFHFEPLPAGLPLRDVSGLIAQLRASPDLSCDDPDARVNIVLQSTADYWISLGSVSLVELKSGWKPFRFTITEPRLLAAMANLFAIRFQLVSRHPVTGSIQLDDLGFVLRGSASH